MKIRIAFFAAARDITGCDWLDLEVDDESSVDSVRGLLGQQYPEIVPIMETCTWAVDHEYVDISQILHDGAEIGLIPPVSGG